MKQKLLLLAFFVLAATAWAQDVDNAGQKWDLSISQLLEQQQSAVDRPSIKGTDASTKRDTTIRVMLKTSNAKALVDSLRAKGYPAKVITPNVVTATLPLSAIPNVAKNPLILHINAATKFKRALNNARILTRTNFVHSGEGLDTPYKGRGVIVAVIDQGFQYNHPAFLNDSNETRVIALWDHNSNLAPVFDSITATDDGMVDAGGHATHVAGIAAGSDRGNGFYGMAPEADIIMIPSSFSNVDILEEFIFIDSVATAQGKPVVTNMSFSSDIGPHDGTTLFDQVINDYFLQDSGRIAAAAMGNEGAMNLHNSHEFVAANDTASFLIKPNSTGRILVDIWGQAGDSVYHLTVTPYLFDPSTGTKKAVRSNATARRNWGYELNESNRKEHYRYYGTVAGLDASVADPHLLLEVTGPAGQVVHMWLHQDTGEFLDTAEVAVTNLKSPDHFYCVGDGSSTIPNTIAVGSYVSRLVFPSIDGNHYQYNNYGNDSIGQISYFSNRGPLLGNTPKPTVLGPGALVVSAANRYVTDFDSTSVFLADSITVNGQKEYYTTMQGTSMASPAVAGIIALWLQANPALTSADVLEIIRTTALKDRFTFYSDWTVDRGYGKIDAYEGLRAALSRVSGIAAVHRSETPVTIQREGNTWRLLFGSVEQNARVDVFNMSGQLVKTQSLGNVTPGTEASVNFESLPSGVYVVHITTPNSTTTRKVLR